MLRLERHAKILQIVREREFIKTEELAKVFDVTPTTIRRDAKELEQQNLVLVDHGGLFIVDYLGKFTEPAYETKLYLNIDIKKAIASAAVDLVNDGDTIILDSGTTNFQIAKRIKQRNYKNLTIVTCDLKIAGEFSSDHQNNVLVLGGIMRKFYYSTYGVFSENILRQIRADKYFLGIDAACIKFGITNIVLEEVPVKKISIANSDQVIAVADSTKFGNHVPYQVGTWDEIDYVVTDKNLSEEYNDFFNETGIKTIVV